MLHSNSLRFLVLKGESTRARTLLIRFHRDGVAFPTRELFTALSYHPHERKSQPDNVAQLVSRGHSTLSVTKTCQIHHSCDTIVFISPQMLLVQSTRWCTLRLTYPICLLCIRPLWTSYGYLRMGRCFALAEFPEIKRHDLDLEYKP